MTTKIVKGRTCSGPECSETADRKIRTGGRQVWACAACAPSLMAVRVCVSCTSVVRDVPDDGVTALRTVRRRFVCASCSYSSPVVGEGTAVPTDAVLTARQETAEIRSETDAVTARIRDMGRTTALRIGWVMIGHAVRDGLSVPDDDAVWDAGTDATLSECVARIDASEVPARLISDGLSGESLARPVVAWVIRVLRSGIRYRDASGSKRGPSGGYLPHRETGWLPLSVVLASNLATAQTNVRRANRPDRAVTALPDDTTEGTFVIGGIGHTKNFGGVTPDPFEVISGPALVMPDGPSGVGWFAVPLSSPMGLQRDAVASLSWPVRAVLASAVWSGNLRSGDDWTGRTVTALRKTLGTDGVVTARSESVRQYGPTPVRFATGTPDGDAVRDAVSAYRDAVASLSARQTARSETEGLSSVVRPASPLTSRDTARRTASVRPSVPYRPVTDGDGNRVRPVIGRMAVPEAPALPDGPALRDGRTFVPRDNSPQGWQSPAIGDKFVSVTYRTTGTLTPETWGVPCLTHMPSWVGDGPEAVPAGALRRLPCGTVVWPA